jgi:hypothetical protein
MSISQIAKCLSDTGIVILRTDEECTHELLINFKNVQIIKCLPGTIAFERQISNGILSGTAIYYCGYEGQKPTKLH